MTDAPVHPNWIPDSNRWGLPTPPSWFLQRLFDFDPLLVLVPSRKKVKKERPAYLLCRHRQYSAGLGDVAMMDNKHPDTNMCVALGVVPIAPLRFKQNQTNFTQQGLESLLADLRSRDTWAVTGGPMGNADALVDAIEDAENREKQKQHRNLWDSFYHRGRDAYRSLTARVGRRNKRASDFHGVARTPTSTPRTSQRVTLTDAT